MDFGLSVGKLIFSLVLGIVVGAVITTSLTSFAFIMTSLIAAFFFYLARSVIQHPRVHT